MILVNAAYQVLSSPRQRREHDLKRAMGPEPVAPPPPAAHRSASAGGVPAAASKPRYVLGAKYTQRSRQARRMNPADYTTHLNGRAPCSQPVPSAAAPPSTGHEPEAAEPPRLGEENSGAQPVPEIRHPSWLQRQLDIAREWEEAFCPEQTQEERYHWKRACNTMLRDLRERRQQRAAEAASKPGTPPFSP